MNGQLIDLVFLAAFTGAALAVLGWLLVLDIVLRFRRWRGERTFAAQVEQHLRDRS